MAIKILKSREPFYDTDALAFISAATITNSIQIMAINDLVVDLKSFNLWNKLNCVYPFVGGNANSHKYNLKDPRDLDVAYRLVFTGVTHSSTGMLPNGTTGYADTKFIASGLSINSASLSYYSRTDNPARACAEIGSVNTVNSYIGILVRYTGNFYYGGVFDGLGQAVATNSSMGMHIVSRTSSTALRLYKNGSLVLAPSYATGALNSLSILIGAMNNSSVGPNNFSNRECAFASIGSGLTNIDAINLHNCVQKYQCYLNRQV